SKRVGVDPPTDEQAATRHHHDHQHVVEQVRGGTPDEHGGPGHGQRTEPVDDPLLQVVGERHGGDAGAERHGLGEDPGHQVLAVVDPGYLDGAPEHVGEQQHEHDRLDGGEDQQVGYPLDLDQVALGDHPAVGGHEHHAAHAFLPFFAGAAGV